MTPSPPPLLRPLALLLLSLLTFGPYFAADSVSAVENFLMPVLGSGREAIGILVSLYNIAAIPAVLGAGLIVDRTGAARASFLFCVVVVVGAALSAASPTLVPLCIGRLLIGAGTESLLVAQQVLLARWFTGRELALSFGVALTFSRLGSLFTFDTSTLVANRHGLPAALWLAVGACLMSLLANGAYWLLHRASVPRGEHAPSPDPVHLRDVARLPGSYWVVTLLCVTFYSAVLPFTALSTDFFHERFGLPLDPVAGQGVVGGLLRNLTHPLETAPGASSVITLAALLLAPFAGAVFDLLARRADARRVGAGLLALGALLLPPAYLLLAFSSASPGVGLALLGAAYVLVPAVLWPLVPLLVPRERQGSAYGVMSMLQNLGLGLFSWLSARLRDATHSYTASLVLLGSLGIVGLFLALRLWRRLPR